MNPVLKEKVLIVSHCYQDFASAFSQFLPISTVVAFRTILCDTVILSVSDASSCSQISLALGLPFF